MNTNIQEVKRELEKTAIFKNVVSLIEDMRKEDDEYVRSFVADEMLTQLHNYITTERSTA